MQTALHTSPNVPPVPAGRMEGQRFTIHIPLQLVVGNRQALKQHVSDAIEAGARDVVLDMSGCEYIDSSGFGVLIVLSKLVRSVRGELRLARLSDDVQTLLELTKLDTLFVITQDPQHRVFR